MHRAPIRLRLTVWYSVALAAGLALFAVAIWVSMRHSLLRDVDIALAEQQTSIESFLATEQNDAAAGLKEELAEYSHGLPQNTIMRVVAEDGSLTFASRGDFPWPGSGALKREMQRVDWHHHAFRLLARKIPLRGREWTITFGDSLDRVNDMLDRLRILLFTLIPLVIAIAAAGGSWLSRRALKPVGDITAAAQSISIENLSERLAVPATGDELQRLSETWNSMLGRLEGAVKQLSRFTADASHELRTPLAIIRSTAEIACRRPRSAESYRMALEQIVTDCERMTQLVEDLLFLARCDAENFSSPMRQLELRPVIAEICSRVESLADAKGISLAMDLLEKPVHVVGDEAAIRRLVLILVDNAIKFCRSGGTVKVALQSDGEQVLLAVADSGPGISESELPHIFDRFYRASDASEGTGGSGLGLSLAHTIAQQHRATIEVSSISGEGSVFTVAFPKSAPSNQVDVLRGAVAINS
jgi:heavy metal sensor kinase